MVRSASVRCPLCEGEKCIWHPGQQRDPIEGNKMRDRIKCPFCDGAGYFNQATEKGAGAVAYHKATLEFRKHQHMMAARAENKKRELRAAALKKLTPEERDALDIKED